MDRGKAKSIIKIFQPYMSGAILASIIIYLWSSFMPVAVFMHAESMWRVHGKIYADVYGWKVKDCDVVPDSQVGLAFADGAWREVPFKFVNDFTPNSSRPVTFMGQRQNFGVWSWDVEGLKKVKSVRMTMQHLCGTSDTAHVQLSVFGPFQWNP